MFVMKKVLVMVMLITLVASLICVGEAYASGPSQVTIVDGQWPEMNFTGVSTSLKPYKDEELRRQSFFGPNNSIYPGAGGYKPYKQISCLALFRENNYVYVDLQYQTVEERCLYFRASDLTNSDVETCDLSTAYRAITTKEVNPKFGPGQQYDKFEVTTDSGNLIYLPANVSIGVFFEMNGWVFAEFSCGHGLVRGWLPVDAVSIP